MKKFSRGPDHPYRTRSSAPRPADPVRDAYAVWSDEVMRRREAESRAACGWRVSFTEKEGQEPQRIVRRATEGQALERVVKRVVDHELAGLLTGPNWGSWWRAAAGEEVARHTRVTSFRNGFLTVAVDSAPLRVELQNFRRPELLATLQRFGGDGVTIRDIKFRSGGKKQPQAPGTRHKA